jgi:dipeptidyl-peptidase-4
MILSDEIRQAPGALVGSRAMATDPLEEFPRQFARTRKFTLGQPRNVTVAPDGSRVLFLRSRAGDDPVNALWVLDVASGTERCIFDPRERGAADEAGLSQAERDRRERTGERSSGVTGYATDTQVRRVVFTLAGRPFVADLAEGWVDELTVPGSVDDPRLDPTGRRVAYVVDGALHVRDLEGGNRVLAADADPDTFWGLPEFIAAEEMHRLRGHWWSPDGRFLAATRVDQSQVGTWYITDPNDPAAAPRAIRYPAAGTANAVVQLFVFDVATGSRVQVGWDAETSPYLARVDWTEGSPLTILVQSRDQRRAHLLAADDGGRTTTVREYTDPAWVALPEDAPRRLADGRVVMVEPDAATDTYRLTVDGEPVTPPGLQVRGVISAGEGVLFRASEDPTELHLWRWTPRDGAVRLSRAGGVHAGEEGGDVLVLVSATLEAPLPTVAVLRDGEPVATIASNAEVPVISPSPRFLRLGPRGLPAALLLPGGREPSEPLPVILSPYGGPAPLANQVWPTTGQNLVTQWLADHGFAVLVVDGRGMDGRGPAWDRSIAGDLTLALEDQLDALADAAARFPFLDASRVAMRGWSFGGYLSALAVLRRPDAVHAAVVGAPVTDWRLYDTHYTERYLGHPDERPEVYERNSIVAEAPTLSRPILVIHGLADDNVVVAHGLRFSATAFAAGRFHELVLLPGAHRTGSEDLAANQLRAELDFLRRSLGVARGPSGGRP